jgi:UDP-N-acetylmuramoyl-L-alanyl-D-glutamate--2,6-diaminopimelate ligase
VRLVELAAVLPGVEVAPAAREVEISGVESDSRRVRRGELFVAVRGAKSDGLAHAAEAIARGAAAVVSDRAPAGPAPPSVPWLRFASPRRAAGILAARIHGDPAGKLVLAGVTGTNGKTSTATLLAARLDMDRRASSEPRDTGRAGAPWTRTARRPRRR